MYVEKIREDFPLLKKLIYFDNAATTLTPKPVVDAISEYYLEYRANVHRGVHRLSQKASQKYEEAHEKVAKLLNAKPEEIVFVKNTTEALNYVALGLEWKKKDKILTTDIEHHSNFLPFLRLREKGVEIEILRTDSYGFIDLEDLEEKIDGVKLLATVHGSNALGVKNPVEKIGKIAKENGCLFCLDAAQTVGHMPVDASKINCDFLAFSGHKGPLGPTGIGVLYIKKDLLESFNPPFLGGGTIVDVSLTSYKLTTPPTRFEAGTPNISGAIGLARGIEYVTKIGLENIEMHERELTDYTLKRFSEIDLIEFYGPKKDRCGLVSFNLKGMNCHDVAAILDEVGNIMVRSGHHCTIPIMKKLGVDGTVRSSYHCYNTKEEIEKMVLILEEVSKNIA